MNLQIGNLSKSMTQGGKEMMAGRGQEMLGRLDVRDALDQSCLRLS
jgi:hypothetical protein